MDGNKNQFIELSDEQLKGLSDEELFAYLDAKALHIRQNNTIKPLGTYHTKQFASISKGSELTTEELKKAKELGKVGDEEYTNTIRDAAQRLNLKPVDLGVKVKKRGGGWVD
jgi:hypothetical protein